jgi:hypothetical protein
MTMTDKLKDAARITLGTGVTLAAIIVSGTMAFAYVKAMAQNNKEVIVEHKQVDEKKWDINRNDFIEVKGDIKSLESVLVEVRLSQRESITHYNHIMSAIDDLNRKFDSFEVNDGNE